MNDVQTTVDTWLAAWTEPDERRRQELVRQVWTEDGRLVDPPLVATGHDELVAAGAGLQAQFPGHTFRRTTAIDGHHELCRYGWELVGADGSIALSGTDVAVVAPGGRLQRVAGFFGDLSAA